MEIVLYFLVPVLGAFFIQLFVGCKAKHKILRYIPLYCLGVCLVFSVIAFASDTGFFIGGNVIAALVWVLIGICFLTGYALSSFVYKIVFKNRK